MATIKKSSDVFPIVLGKIVAHIRQEKGLSQAQFAAAMGSTQATISRMEKGEVTPDAVTFQKLATALGMSADSLYRKIEGVTARARELTPRTTGHPVPKSTEWWEVALPILGAVGLGALIGLAAALLLNNNDD